MSSSMETMRPLELLDFSHWYYRMMLREIVPPLRGGKFVILRHGPQEYLVLAPKDMTAYHSGIVAAYGENQTPPVKADELACLGGGYWQLAEGGELRLWGESQAYGPYPRAPLAGRAELGGYRLHLA